MLTDFCKTRTMRFLRIRGEILKILESKKGTKHSKFLAKSYFFVGAIDT